MDICATLYTNLILIFLGPIVWYQEFEYAIGHWLQKATEHVFGCVLCAPGCFSLFRGSALMDDNVARCYAIRASEAGHYVQYDQGRKNLRFLYFIYSYRSTMSKQSQYRELTIKTVSNLL